jgi:beta-galactosidase
MSIGNRKYNYFFRLLLALVYLVNGESLIVYAQSPRKDISLNDGWLSIDSDIAVFPGNGWKAVSVPHNWDAYEGYRRLLHGNKHGNAQYVKTFRLQETKNNKRVFLFFEGVGSYATVELNGKKVGQHAGGRTSFTIDITAIVKTDGTNNSLLVRVSHPAGIKDLPWVCGGCSEERGFSEGSQPMGIFRPVHLIITSDLRIQPFGVHAWSEIKGDNARLNITATLKNYSLSDRKITIAHQLLDAKGKLQGQTQEVWRIRPGDSVIFEPVNIEINKPRLWSPTDPYLYTIKTTIKENNKITDQETTEFGFRTISWNDPTHQFFINGKPLFINGVAEYEHLMGQSHAFSPEQVRSRMKWVKAAGFNAFRDGHQPHNLLYGQLCDKQGILWWTQLSAHIWYDTPAFRENFKQLLKEWVIERRNNPSVILWGLQNESQLPEDFARECTDLIRQLDPTASTQRLVTTCNGGSGTDWDVPQNWTGTYGGDPNTYASDLKKQVLVGEYGAWRTLGLHTEGGFVQNGILSEDRMTQLMEQKVRLAESVKDSVAGHFFWLLTSHENPGRVQGGEGLRELDRVGPVNYKGLLSPWEEPLDVYYMFRANYAPKEKEPMVYIVSHTWPGRWMKPGIKDSIVVYSNCDEVELFNDMGSSSLGRRNRNGIGSHFQWDSVNIQYNILYAVGYVNGKLVAKDTIVLNHLPKSPGFNKLISKGKSITTGQPGYNYRYRVNCGGPGYKDSNGTWWQADEINGGTGRIGMYSWTNEFSGIPTYYGSQRKTSSPIKGTADWPLFQDFVYGKDKLRYEFNLPDGEYLVELYFIEPWLGIGGGINAAKMRLFDVAINDKIVLKDLDIWKEAGTNTALKKIVKANANNGRLVITFPRSPAGEALISAIAIAANFYDPYGSIPINNVEINCTSCSRLTWLDEGAKQYADDSIAFHSLPSNLYGAGWVQYAAKNTDHTTTLRTEVETDVFVGVDPFSISDTDWLAGFEPMQTFIETDEGGGKKYNVYRKRVKSGTSTKFNFPVLAWQPASNLQPAYDLKPTKAYRANSSSYTAGVVRENFSGKECTIVKQADEITIEWPVQTGVADIYSITLNYYYPGDTVNANLQLIQAGGSMMQNELLHFTFTKPGKWNSISINTGSMINAGNYIIKLKGKGLEGLAVSGIEIK